MGSPSLDSSCAPAAAAPRRVVEGGDQCGRRALQQLRVLVEQQAQLPPGAAQQRRVVLGLAGAAVERDQPDVVAAGLDRGDRAVVGAVVQHKHLVLQRRAGDVRSIASRHASRSSRPLVFTTQKESFIAARPVGHRALEHGPHPLGQQAAVELRLRKPARVSAQSRGALGVVAQLEHPVRQVRRVAGARRRRPASLRSTSSRCQPSVFTIAARPAAKVSNSLLGELVASTGTSLKIVMHASEAAASLAADGLSPAGSSTHVRQPAAAHVLLDRATPLALALQHEGHAVLAAFAQDRRRLHHLRQVVRLAHGAEVGAEERILRGPAARAGRRGRRRARTGRGRTRWGSSPPGRAPPRPPITPSRIPGESATTRAEAR